MNWTIRARLLTGFALLIVACTALGGAAVFGFNRAATATDRLTEMSDDLAVGANSMEALLRVRMRVKDFLITNSDDDARSYVDLAKSFTESMRISAERFEDPRRRELAAEMTGKFEAYDRAFARVKEVIGERNSRIESMHQIGKDARVAFTNIIAEARRTNDIATMALAAEAQESLVLARLYALGYARSSNPRDATEYERFRTELVGALSTAPRAGATGADFAEAARLTDAFQAEFDAVRSLVGERNELVLNDMDVVGPEIMALGQQVRESLVEDTDELRNEAVAIVAGMRATVLAVATGVVAVGVAIALALSRSIVRSITVVVDRLREIADGDGDLTVRLRDTGKDEFAELGRCFNRFVVKLSEVIGSAKTVSLAVASASQQVAASSHEIAANLERQEAQAAQISSAAVEMSQTVADVARNAASASDASASNKNTASEGSEVVGSTAAEMEAIASEVQSAAAIVIGLGERGDQIGDIIEVINDIAEQTNLLALNAAIEAARAGEHGRGFAVVADEVRKLAERTTSATEQVAQSIGEIQRETKTAVERIESGSARAAQGVTLAKEAGQSLHSILDSSESVRSMVTSIAAATEEQSATSEQIARVISEMSDMSRETSNGARQSSEAASLLSSQAEALQNTVSRFRLE